MFRGSVTLLVLLGWTPILQASAGQDETRLLDPCRRYLQKFADQSLSRFSTKIAERVKQRAVDSGQDAGTAYRSIALDWLSDNQGDLQKRRPAQVLLFCWWVVKLEGSGIGLPTVVKENLSKKDVAEFVQYLDIAVKEKDDESSKHARRRGASPKSRP